MASQSTKLSISSREVSNSRSTRRLRREGQVPGVLYGGGDDAVPFAVDERELRHALAARGAVIELQLGGEATPAVLKDAQRHPVRGHTMHVDFLRVNLNVAIHAVVTLELVGGESAPGVIEGGVLEHVTREINIEALPTDIPERLQLDVSSMQVNDTLTLSAVEAPQGGGNNSGFNKFGHQTDSAPTGTAQHSASAKQSVHADSSASHYTPQSTSHVSSDHAGLVSDGGHSGSSSSSHTSSHDSGDGGSSSHGSSHGDSSGGHGVESIAVH